MFNTVLLVYRSRNQVSEKPPAPIRTSQLVANINREAFDRRYRMLCVKTSDKWFPHGGRILDVPLLSQNKVAVSVSFEKVNQFYVLCDNNTQDIAALKETLRTKDGGDKITIDDVFAEDADDHVLLRLLFAALSNAGSDEGDEYRFNNLTGKLYCVVPNTIKYEPRGSKTISTVSCIEIKVSDKMTLELPVRSFTNLKFKDKIDFGKSKPNEYARYVFSQDNCTFRRKLEVDGDDTGCFIKRKMKDAKRVTVPFLSLSPKPFRACKMGILAVALKRFKEQFGDICTLEFETIENCTPIAMKNAELRENKNAIAALFKSKQVRIVDMIGGSKGEAFCLTIKRLLKETYDVDASVIASIAKEKREEWLNICAIHNRAWYEEHGQDDPHTTSADSSVQHVTIEDFGGNEKAQKAAIKAVVHELLIKDDLVHKRITLFDWSTLALAEDVVFGWRKKEKHAGTTKEWSRYFFLKVAADGRFEITQREGNDLILPEDEYADCCRVFDENKDADELIKRSDSISAICDTGLFGVPEIEKIKAQIDSTGKSISHNQESRDELMWSILDLKSFQKDGCTCYFAGPIGYTMKPNIPHTTHIRQIKTYKGSPLSFDKLLRLMDVTFVHNEQLTVIPFPFKYLREWAAKTGGGKQEEREE